MDNRRVIPELKLRSEVFRRNSAAVVRILHDRAWFNHPLTHPEDMRQFIYWLNFKRPKSWYVNYFARPGRCAHFLFLFSLPEKGCFQVRSTYCVLKFILVAGSKYIIA